MVWLHTPVRHVREGRGTLLLKLAILERLRLDARQLLAAQAAQFEPLLLGLERGAAEPHSGFEPILMAWRLVSARGALQFLGRLRVCVRPMHCHYCSFP